MKTTLKALLLASVFGGIASTAFAADLIIDTPPVYVEPEPISDSVFYIGANIGYGMGFADHQPAAPVGPGGLGNDIDLAGLIVGGQVGAMFNITDSIAAGFQADIDWSDINGTFVSGGGTTYTHSIDWLGTLEGRLGFDGGAFTPYVAGGFAVAQGTRTSDFFGPVVSDTQIHTGLSVGAGIVLEVSENINLDLEYRHQVFQPMTYDTGGTPPSVALSVDTVRLGLNLSF